MGHGDLGPTRPKSGAADDAECVTGHTLGRTDDLLQRGDLGEQRPDQVGLGLGRVLTHADDGGRDVTEQQGAKERQGSLRLLLAAPGGEHHELIEV